MIIDQLISADIPKAIRGDSPDLIRQLMEENNLSELPLTDGDQYLALLKENQLLNWEENNLDNLDLRFKPAIQTGSHPYEAIRIMYAQGLSVLPVIEQSNYLGAVKMEEVIKFFTETGSLEIPGAILVLEMERRQYSLWEIARICEQEGILVLTAQTKFLYPEDLVQVTLKVNTKEIAGLGQSFDRHGINVKLMYGDEEYNEEMMERYKLLMNYINM